MYQPLPVLAANPEPETLIGYGCRVLRFVMRTGVTATLDTEALQAADHAYPAAIAGYGRDAAYASTIEHLRQAREIILSALRAREHDTKARLDALGAPERTGPQPSSPVPLRPNPRTNPPTADANPIPRQPVPVMSADF